MLATFTLSSVCAYLSGAVSIKCFVLRLFLLSCDDFEESWCDLM